MIRVAPVHLALLNRLSETVTEATAGVGILIDGGLPDGESIPRIRDAAGRDTQSVVPHAYLRMGDVLTRRRGRGLDGARNALGVLTFTVSCVAGDNYKLSQLRDSIWDSLIGWIPTEGCGEIEGDDGGYSPPLVPGVLKPQVYLDDLGFWTTVGAITATV